MNTPNSQHTHDGTVRLLVKIVSLVLVGLAAYFAIFYGLRQISPASTVASSTPIVATSTAATSSPVVTSTTTLPVVTPVPTKPAPTPAPTSSARVITNADNNTTVYVSKGQEVEIKYGTSLHWSLSFDPDTILTAERNTMESDGVQGIYTASEIGTTTLKATGAPICKPDQACPMFLAVSTVTIVVQ